MRSPPFGPIALSLALHGCALMLVASLALQRSHPAPHRELTIGLAILPTLGQAGEPMPAPGAAPAGAPESLPAEAGASDQAASPPVDAAATPPPALLADAQPAPVPPAIGVTAALSAAPAVPTGVPDIVGSVDAAPAMGMPSPVQGAAEAPVAEAASAAAVDAKPTAPLLAPASDRPESEAEQSDSVAATQARPAVVAEAETPPGLVAAVPAEAVPAPASPAPVLPAAAPEDLTPAAVVAVGAVDAAPAEHPPATPAESQALALAEPSEEHAADLVPDLTADAARASRFIARYDGGPCVDVAATRLAGGVAEVDGFAPSTAPFGTFHQAFAAAVGFEPTLIGQRIWSPQCPAVEALHRLHVGGGPAPVLRLDGIAVAGGSAVAGTVADPAHRPLRLFLVSEDGAVSDVSRAIGVAGDPARFTLPMPTGRPGGAVPQLLLAVAGAIPPAASTMAPREATAFFAALATAAARSPAPPGAAGKLFLLGR